MKNKEKEFQRDRDIIRFIYSYLFPFSLIITFESHIRNPTYTSVSKRPINHRDTRINVSYRPRPRNVIIWKLMASGLLGPSGGCMRVGSTTVDFHPQCAKDIPRKGRGSINLGRRTANSVVIHG